MARYHVHNATVPYVGLAYYGPHMQDIGFEEGSTADFGTRKEAIECADKLQAVCETGWLVVHSFYERVEYDSRPRIE
ncbi:hypothetical protein fHeYen902_184 [Yersinia phage fHe-Yen9-02]|nr:hypothetical protein fHeYen902_184 [Yersinia phage fHe-Yen9-02]